MSVNDKQVGGNHYKKQKIQHWDYVLANEIPYLEAQVIKYVSRWRDKNGLEDLRKAQHFLEKLIEVEQEKINELRIRQRAIQAQCEHEWVISGMSTCVECSLAMKTEDKEGNAVPLPVKGLPTSNEIPGEPGRNYVDQG